MAGGQNYFKGGSGCTGGFLFAQTAALYSAPKPRYYPVAYRKTQPGSFTNFLGGKERIEYLVQVFPLDSAPRIHNYGFDFSCRLNPGGFLF